MSRQRLHPSVRESTTETCPRCRGRGSIRTVESMSLQMLTRMEDWAESGKKPTLVVQVPSETGEYLMNNKRESIARIEENHEVKITLQIKPELMIPHYRIERQWNENNQQRVEVLEDTSKGRKPAKPNRKLNQLKPVVGVPTPQKRTAKKTSSLPACVTALYNILTGASRKTNSAEEERKEQHKNRNRNRRNQSRNRKNKPNKPKTEATNKAPQKKATANKPKTDNNPAENKDIANKAEQEKQEGAPQRKRRRRRRRPAKRTGEETTVNTANNNQQTDAPKAVEGNTTKPKKTENKESHKAKKQVEAKPEKLKQPSSVNE